MIAFRPTNRSTHNRRGSIALVMVLVTVAMLTAIVVEVMYRAKVAETVVTNRRDGEKAYELARAAVRWSIFRLQLDSVLDGIPVIPNTNYGGKKDDLSEVQWAVPLPYPLPVALLAGEQKKDAENPEEITDSSKLATDTESEGTFVSTIHDESAKINLNDVGSATLGQQAPWSGAAEVLENLLTGPRFQKYFRNKDHRELLWAIDDWIDMDSEVNHLGGGIEDVEYQLEDKNAHVKNAPFYSLAELHMLKPMNDELFRELKPFVTIYPFEARTPRVSSQPVYPLGMININTAPLELIAAIFSRQAFQDQKERLECAQRLVKFRKNAVFRSVQGTEPSFVGATQQFCSIASAEQGGPQIFTTTVSRILSIRSDTFSVEASGLVNSVEKTVMTVISRQDSQKPKLLYWKVI